MEGLNGKAAQYEHNFGKLAGIYLHKTPWLGIGAGQMRWQTFMLLDTPNLNPAKMIFEHSHNLFIHLLTEMGIGAALLALIGLGAWARAFKWRELHLETWWLIALLGVIGIHSMLEYPLWYTYFLGVFAFLLGAGEEKLTQFNLAKFGKLAGVGTISVVFLVSILNLATMLLAYVKIEKNLSVAMQKGLSQKELPIFMQDMTWVHENSLLSPYAELMLATYMTPNEKLVDDQLWLSENALRFMPMRKIAYQEVLLHKIKGDQATAVKHLNRTLIAYPGNFTKELDRLPMKYWQDYLDVLSVARPIPIKKQHTAP